MELWNVTRRFAHAKATYSGYFCQTNLLDRNKMEGESWTGNETNVSYSLDGHFGHCTSLYQNLAGLKFLRMASNPQNLRKFHPVKICIYTYGTNPNPNPNTKVCIIGNTLYMKACLQFFIKMLYIYCFLSPKQTKYHYTQVRSQIMGDVCELSYENGSLCCCTVLCRYRQYSASADHRELGLLP